jgi:hypothetical protein
MDKEKIVFAKGTLNQQDFKTRKENYINMAENRFEYWCKDKGFKFKKLMLNQDDDWAKHPIGAWHSLGLIKSFPDYFMYKNQECAYVELKNSLNIKRKDLKSYISFENQFCNGRDVKYFICMPTVTRMNFFTLDEILDLLTRAEIDQYHDGHKIYRIKI